MMAYRTHKLTNIVHAETGELVGTALTSKDAQAIVTEMNSYVKACEGVIEGDGDVLAPLIKETSQPVVYTVKHNFEIFRDELFIAYTWESGDAQRIVEELNTQAETIADLKAELAEYDADNMKKAELLREMIQDNIELTDRVTELIAEREQLIYLDIQGLARENMKLEAERDEYKRAFRILHSLDYTNDATDDLMFEDAESYAVLSLLIDEINNEAGSDEASTPEASPLEAMIAESADDSTQRILDAVEDIESHAGVACSKCGGEGFVYEPGEVARGVFEPHKVNCPTCDPYPVQSLDTTPRYVIEINEHELGKNYDIIDILNNGIVATRYLEDEAEELLAKLNARESEDS